MWSTYLVPLLESADAEEEGGILWTWLASFPHQLMPNSLNRHAQLTRIPHSVATIIFQYPSFCHSPQAVTLSQSLSVEAVSKTQTNDCWGIFQFLQHILVGDGSILKCIFLT